MEDRGIVINVKRSYFNNNHLNLWFQRQVIYFVLSFMIIISADCITSEFHPLFL